MVPHVWLPDKIVTDEGQELTWDKTGPRRRIELPVVQGDRERPISER